MRLRAVSLMLFTLLVGIAVLPAAACDLEQKAASNRTVTAFLTRTRLGGRVHATSAARCLPS